jgi:hypothetical protein
MKKTGAALAALAVLLSLCSCTSRPASIPASPGSITGTVVDASGPVALATVRIQATRVQALTDARGAFSLPVSAGTGGVTVSAWKQGCYCAKAERVEPGARGVLLTLRPYQENDNPDYEWMPPVGEVSCMSCKPEVTRTWLESDAHARSAVNPRFLTMYKGTDTAGNQSPVTRTASSRDYGTIPLRPDTTQAWYGPGYKLDFPDTAGNCACCHLPGSAVDDPYGVDPSSASGTDAYGIHCDFCHKVADVRLEATTGLPHPNQPGVLSMDIRRPFPGDPDRYQLFFGPFDDDNVPEEDTYLPLIRQSAFCAACHRGDFWGTVVYDSYGEWLASPWSNPATGKTCQQCHMSVPTILDGNPVTNVAAGKGGVERDPASISAHDFPGAASAQLLQNAVSLDAAARIAGGRLTVDVRITNDRAGHHVPTDSPLRHLILLVRAFGADGAALARVSGPVLPDWCGIGDPGAGCYAGLPGTAYAKVLQERWTGVTPTGAYWNPVAIVSDNRIAAFADDTTSYIFAAPPDGAARVEVRLLFRRAYKDLMDIKGWNVPDILMASRSLEVTAR